jgi:hypothetical protein
MRRAIAVVAALAVAATAGCGAFGDDPVTERVQQPGLLTKRQVERHPEGTPQRAFFDWWRAVQYDNAAVAVRYYARSAGVTVDTLDRQLGIGLEVMGLTARPHLVEVDESGDTAVVLTLLERVVENPNGRADRVRKPRGFNLVREDGEWKLADNRFLGRQEQIYNNFTAPLREQQEREQQGQEP